MVQGIILPKQGLQMETGMLVRWMKAPGDAVASGEAVAEMETDKVTAEIESPADGVLLKILHDE
ncbi:MAG: lipoyl domain-containing protein, partial [Kiritimatiellales bacterium]